MGRFVCDFLFGGAGFLNPKPSNQNVSECKLPGVKGRLGVRHFNDFERAGGLLCPRR